MTDSGQTGGLSGRLSGGQTSGLTGEMSGKLSGGQTSKLTGSLTVDRQADFQVDRQLG